MKKLLAALVILSGLLFTSPETARATTHLPSSVAVMSTVVSCLSGGGWLSEHHLYSTFDGGIMRIDSSSWPQAVWRPNGFTNISSDSYFRLLVEHSASKATFSVGATLRITQTVWPGGVVYRYAQRTAYRPNC